MNLNHPNEYFSESRKILNGGAQARVNAVSSIKVKTEVKEEPMNDSNVSGTTPLDTTKDTTIQDTTIEDMDFDMDDDINIL